MQVVRRTSFVSTPWKNGGGITHEAIRVPADGDAFRWRVSVAEIASSGPFSDFRDYRRVMVLLQGSGVRLEFDGALARELRTAGDLIEFDGAARTSCELLAGPCTDLNLMLSKALRFVSANVGAWLEPQILTATDGEIVLVVPITGPVSVDAAGLVLSLAPWDLAVLSKGECAAFTGAGDALVFLARFEDNSL